LRVEDLVRDWQEPVDAISSRALAPFDRLAAWLEPLLVGDAVAYLHKGAEFDGEFEDATTRWTLDLLQHRSRFGPGVIVEVRGVKRRSKQAQEP
jgi:16S rRNA (guanine527-N7)-methyltransferase